MQIKTNRNKMKYQPINKGQRIMNILQIIQGFKKILKHIWDLLVV